MTCHSDDDPASAEVTNKRITLCVLLRSQISILRAQKVALQTREDLRAKCTAALVSALTNNRTAQDSAEYKYITALNDEAAAMGTQAAALEKDSEAMGEQIQALKDWFKERGLDPGEVKDAAGSD